MARVFGVTPYSKTQASPIEEDSFQKITDEDLQAADEALNSELVWYAGYTLLTVLIFLAFVACFAMDPRAGVIAFGTGSPCCLFCPCIKSLYKYTDPAALIQAATNSYVPGILVTKDGKIESYEPSDEEIEALFDLVNEFCTPT